MLCKYRTKSQLPRSPAEPVVWAMQGVLPDLREFSQEGGCPLPCSLSSGCPTYDTSPPHHGHTSNSGYSEGEGRPLESEPARPWQHVASLNAWIYVEGASPSSKECQKQGCFCAGLPSHAFSPGREKVNGRFLPNGSQLFIFLSDPLL